MTIHKNEIELARITLANFKENSTVYRPGSFSHYKALSEKQAKYIKILESSNAALLESLQRLENQLKAKQSYIDTQTKLQIKASQEI